ncbi:hypothetical protein [Streptomyces sp. SAJ15]|uniref:hypothetical protein n=1 Tax=Streptomyces sp. SAJ15 TaxID=2011095 RepID=UPI0011863783|nr:hypothetical protein [Streptomyces sp. SAJ15]TVL93016.1 hypothetical protein CD790_07755 [Streptomyces sp. SAJ15]
MQMRNRAIRAAVVTVAAGAATLAVVAASGTAQAQPRKAATGPAFLAPKELPPHASSAWSAGAVTAGLPEAPFCVEDTLPKAGSSHRRFWTEYDTGATQIVVRTKSEAAAKQLAAAAEKKIRNCAADWERKYPEATASWRDYGTLPAEDGAHVYGVHTESPDSEPGIHLFGVGRDRATVTLVDWGQMGDYRHAPVADFKRTTTTAVVKLHR